MRRRNDRERATHGEGPAPAGAGSASPEPGLCASCAHARPISSARGSTFWLCGLADLDPRYARYPRLPVAACSGHRPASGPG